MSKKFTNTLRGLTLATLAFSLAACVDPSTFTGTAASSNIQTTNLNNAVNKVNGVVDKVSGAASALGLDSKSLDATSALGDKAALVQQLISKASVTSPSDKGILANLEAGKYVNSSQLSLLLDSTNNQYLKNGIIVQLAEKLIGENKLDAAQYYLGQFVHSSDAKQNNDYAFLASKVGSLLGDQQLASKTNDLDVTKLPAAQKYEAVLLQLENSFKTTNYDQALDYVNKGYSLLPVAQRKQLVDATLKRLMNLSADELATYAQTAATNGNSLNIGWYNLAQLAVANKSNAAKLNDAWSIWYNTFKPINHPAALTAPSIFKQTALVAQDSPKNIFVLLPLTNDRFGPYARAVQAGIEQANRDSKLNVNLQYVDTAQYNINDSLATAYQGNADLIIGPLTNENVRLASGYNLQRPELMLNFTSAAPNVNACYIAQKIEDEAERGVQLFKSLNVKNPVVVVANSSSFMRAKSKFVQSWLNSKQQNVKAYSYKSLNDLNNLAANLSRQSPAVDGVAFFGDAQALVKFNQFWNISSNRKINIFATSASNYVTLGKSKLADINGVYFTENTLVAQPDSVLSQAASKATNGDYNLLRLYGFGYDAFNIAQNFSSFQKVQSYSLGNTTSGNISRNNNSHCVLENQPTIYRVENGVFTKFAN